MWPGVPGHISLFSIHQAPTVSHYTPASMWCTTSERAIQPVPVRVYNADAKLLTLPSGGYRIRKSSLNFDFLLSGPSLLLYMSRPYFWFPQHLAPRRTPIGSKGALSGGLRDFLARLFSPQTAGAESFRLYIHEIINLIPSGTPLGESRNIHFFFLLLSQIQNNNTLLKHHFYTVKNEEYKISTLHLFFLVICHNSLVNCSMEHLRTPFKNSIHSRRQIQFGSI